MRSKPPMQADKILTAAAELFATQRFHEARMEDIAALAEVGKGTLYRYFKDKEELYLALLERAALGLAVRLGAKVDRADTPRDQLESLVEAILGFFDENPHLFDLIQHAEVMKRPGQAFPWQKARDLTAGTLRSIFAVAAARGDFHIDDPDLAVHMLLGGMRSVVRFGVHPRRPDLPRRLVAGLLAGYARPTLRPGEAYPAGTNWPVEQSAI